MVQMMPVTRPFALSEQSKGFSIRYRSTVVVLLSAALLAACGSSPKVNTQAPVVDRSNGKVASVAPANAATQPPPPGQENAGKPGYYTVRQGDTLIGIGLEAGQSWREIAKWNGLTNPNVIEVGQVLRVVPPVAVTPAPATVAAAGVSTAPVAGGTDRAQGKPLSAAGAKSDAATPASTASSSAPAAAVSEDVAFMWPTNGNSILDRFDDAHNKGLDLGGTVGDPVLAAADGRVVYAGSGLRGYGNLIIIKHNNTYLTAYAHNKTLLVKEDQNVRKGQKIAEMGANNDTPMLHFEVRRQGKPVDPLKYLPSR